MSRGPGKIQRAVCDLLASARSVEPWPVFMSAVVLARLAYSTESPSAGQLETVRPCADRPGYQPPDPGELAAAVEAFARREEPPGAALTAANAYSGTALGPVDLARWAELRLRDEEEKRARWQAARPARAERVRLGPYFVDPDTVPNECPCCRQPVDPTAWDTARFKDP